MKGISLLTALLVVASVGIMPGTVVADDKWPEKCRNASLVSDENISGQINEVPGDQDALLVEVPERGDFVSIQILAQEQVEIDVSHTKTNSNVQWRNAHSVEVRDTGFGFDAEFSPNVQGSLEIWPTDEGGNICIRFNKPSELSDDTLPYSWDMSQLLNERFPDNEGSQTDNQDSDGDEVTDSEVSDLQSRISELESQLEQKNQTISELESRIEELESQSSDGSGSDVTIDVTVNPANGQKFVEGGEAVVQAESENADVSEMQVEYGAGTYELDSSGEVAIPLAETGTQDMSLVHGDTTKQVSIDVQAEDGQNQQDQQDTSSTNGPGFGVVVAMIAILGGALLFGRYR